MKCPICEFEPLVPVHIEGTSVQPPDIRQMLVNHIAYRHISAATNKEAEEIANVIIKLMEE